MFKLHKNIQLVKVCCREAVNFLNHAVDWHWNRLLLRVYMKKTLVLIVLLSPFQCWGSSLLKTLVKKASDLFVDEQPVFERYVALRYSEGDMPIDKDFELVITALFFRLYVDVLPYKAFQEEISYVQALQNHRAQTGTEDEALEEKKELYDSVNSAFEDTSWRFLLTSTEKKDFPLVLLRLRDMYAIGKALDQSHSGSEEGCEFCKVCCDDLYTLCNPNESLGMLLPPQEGLLKKAKKLIVSSEEKQIHSLPLHAAVERNLWELTNVLLQYGALPDEEDLEKKTAISYAKGASYKSIRVVLELFSRYRKLICSIKPRKKGHPLLCKLISACPGLASRCIWDSEGYNVLHRAILADDKDLVATLLLYEPYFIIDSTMTGALPIFFALQKSKFKALCGIVCAAYPYIPNKA